MKNKKQIAKNIQMVFQDAASSLNPKHNIRYILNEVLNKFYNWSEEETAWRKDLAKDEAIDAFHFMLNILLLLDITPEELVNRYVKKNTINHVRQDNNY